MEKEKYDISREPQVEFASTTHNPVASQPVLHQPTYVTGTIAAPPATVYAAPYGHQGANAVYATPAYGQPPAGNQEPRRPYPRNRWSDSICDWPRNLYPSCYCVCCVCCGIYLSAQSALTIFFYNCRYNPCFNFLFSFFFKQSVKKLATQI